MSTNVSVTQNLTEIAQDQSWLEPLLRITCVKIKVENLCKPIENLFLRLHFCLK